MITETEMLERFAGSYEFPPLVLCAAGRPRSDRELGVDAVLEAKIDNRRMRFAAEFKSRNTPRVFEDALPRLVQAAKRLKLLPMLVVPYLNDSQLLELQRQEVSGVDLCGNGIITSPGKLLIYRTGRPNQFPDSQPTKYAYRGATSLVARALLCRAQYRSLEEISQEIEFRGGNVALSTISKALKRFESDVIIDRAANQIRLRQPDKLLEKLSSSYTPAKIAKTITLAFKSSLSASRSASIRQLADLLANERPDIPVVLSGRSSIEAYAVMPRQDAPVLYTTNIDRLASTWADAIEPTSRFVDFELQQTSDATVYFDVRTRANLPYASPIQVYLECSAGDKRDEEIAAQVKREILSDLKL